MFHMLCVQIFKVSVSMFHMYVVKVQLYKLYLVNGIVFEV